MPVCRSRFYCLEAVCVDIVFSDLVLHDALGGSEESSCFALVAPGGFHRIHDYEALIGCYEAFQFPLLLFLRGYHLLLHREGQMYAVDSVTSCEQNGPFDAILKLAHVARPMVCKQEVNGWCGDVMNGFFELLGVILHKVICQQDDISTALPQWRHVNREHIEPVV